jgi:hypothetical protein
MTAKKKPAGAVRRALEVTAPDYMAGADVKALQASINKAFRRMKIDRAIEVDGKFGPATLDASRQVARAVGVVAESAKKLSAGRLTESAQKLIRGRDKSKAEIRATRRRRLYRRRLRKRYAATLQTRAFRIAENLVGVMESGGNNMGEKVSEIIRANGGTGPEPWCGDFVAYAYKNAGSKAVTRSWAAVRLLSGVAGIKFTSTPKRGDLVRFTFDHVGMFDRDNGDGTITTIEGNTGASGAVSDSATGGDGVYRKIRDKSLVADYLRVTR